MMEVLFLTGVLLTVIGGARLVVHALCPPREQEPTDEVAPRAELDT